MYSRRDLVRALGGLPFLPHLKAQAGALDLRHRLLGRTGRWVTPFGLGGQASLQWTGEGIDPADIIVRAFELGVNYFDTANAYGPSQANYGEAFRRLQVTPAARERIYVATKTGNRYAMDASRPAAATAISDLRRSMTTLFGDGRGWVPEGAYLDAMQIHNLQSMDHVPQIYEGMETRGSRMPDRIGALAGLLDYRDGTNYTGLNPEQHRWLRHIGITGHHNSPVLMETIRRDTWDMIDTVLVGMNANDRRTASHQFNVLPLAVARGLGVIVMKVFADGAFYGKEARFSNRASDVVLTVGRDGGVPPADLLRYPLSLPGVSTVIAGIGRINREDPAQDQLVSNLTTCLGSDVASEAEMRRIEEDVAAVHGITANYFNERRNAIQQPAGVELERDGDRWVIRWNTALAAGEALRSYRIWDGERLLRSVPYRPQLTNAPQTAWVTGEEITSGNVRVTASTLAAGVTD